MAYTYYLADCSHAAIEDCYYRGIVNGTFVKNVEAGDTIVLPSGSGTWGAPASNPGNGGRIYFILPITITGQGDDTVITIDENGSTYNSGVINLWSAITFANMKIIGANTRPVTPIVVSPYNNTAPGGINFTGAGLRITNITYQGRGGSSYFMYGAKVSSALIDNCRISGATGNSELIFARGPDNAWQNNNTIGGANNIFIEDCVFSGAGYVSDANSNCRMVVRNCTITGAIKVDGHGLASNASPARGVRNMEVYNNTWTYSSPFWAAIELRGGTNMVFNNTSAVTNGWFFLTDYGYLATWPNFGNVYQTPVNYPIKDQIGVSKDPKTAAGEPNYIWGNRAAGSVWPRQTKAVPAAASTLYQSQTGTASFTEYDMIRANRDFFAEAGFDTTQPGGVTIGTAAQMAATTPTTQSVGFWVTDEGTWNQSGTGSQGRLYTWSGSSWNLYYEPYTYPHPLRSASVDLTPTPTPTVTPTENLTPTPTVTPTITLTSTPTITPTITVTPTPSVTETPTPTPSVTVTPTITVTPTPSVTETPTPTPTPSVTVTPTITVTPTLTLTPTSTLYPKISINPLFYNSTKFPLWEKSTFLLRDGKYSEIIGPSGSSIYAGAIVPLTASQVYYSFDYYAIYPPHTIHSAGAFWYTTVGGFTASYDPNTIVRIGANISITGSDSGIRAIYR